MTLYSLHVIKGPEQGKVYPLEGDKITIGRDSSCEISIDDPAVSRHHAKVTFRGSNLTLEDLGSVNGTFINGVRINSDSLMVNDCMTLGKIELQLRRVEDTFLAPQKASHSPASEDGTSSHQVPQQLLTSDRKPDSDPIMEITRKLGSDELTSLLSRSHACLGAMYRVIHLCSSISDLDELLDRILSETFAILRPERAIVLLIDHDSGQLETRASRRQNGQDLEPDSRISLNIISHVVEKKESVLIANAMVDSRFAHADSVVLHNMRSVMCSPLRGRKGIVGILQVDSSADSGEFGQDDLMLLDAIGSAAGIALEDALLYREKLCYERHIAMGKATAGLAHCTRNILGTMEGSIGMIEKGLDDGDLNMARRILKLLGQSRQRLNDLVMDMLVYSKERKAEIQSCQINEICEEVAELCRDKIQKKKADLRLVLDPRLTHIQADPVGIHRCLLNLLNNAIDALAPEEGEVTISTRLQQDGSMLLKVQDNGVGIPEQLLQKIFGPYFSTKGNQGIGLGLAVTKQIIEDHGGRIELHSSLGQGSKFTIRLPHEKNQAHRSRVEVKRYL